MVITLAFIVILCAVFAGVVIGWFCHRGMIKCVNKKEDVKEEAITMAKQIISVCGGHKWTAQCNGVNPSPSGCEGCTKFLNDLCPAREFIKNYGTKKGGAK